MEMAPQVKSVGNKSRGIFSERDLARFSASELNPGKYSDLLDYKLPFERSFAKKNILSYSFCSREILFQSNEAFLLLALSLILKRYTQLDQFVVTREIQKENRVYGIPLVVCVDEAAPIQTGLERAETLLGKPYNYKQAALLEGVQVLPFCVEFIDHSQTKIDNAENTYSKIRNLCKLKLVFVKKPGNIWLLELHYMDSLFSKREMDLFLEHLSCVVSQLTKTQKKSRHSDINFLTEQDLNVRREACLSLDITEKPLIDHLVSISEQFSCKTAIVDRKESLTYKELFSKARTLAKLLESEYSIRHKRIAFQLEKTRYYPIVILACLMCEACFIPIPTDCPRERKAELLALTSPDLLIEYSQKLQITDLGNTVKKTHQGEAYIMFTSGSTGKAKACVIGNENLKQFLFSALSTIGLKKEDSAAFLAAPSFSSSLRQLIMPLMVGASLHIIDDKIKSDPVSFMRYIKNQKISVIQVTPSYFKLFIMLLRIHCIIQSKDPDLLVNDLRLVISASEPLMPDTLLDWFNDLSQGSEVINMYGQTETSGVVTAYQISKESFFPEEGISPIGKPIPNVEVKVISKGQVCPIGVAGELIVFGPTIGMGYLEQDGVASYCQEINGRPGYNTGDMGYMRTDGSLIFVGRQDELINVRGMRVDLNEINSVLREHPSIRDVAIVTDGEGIDKVKIAFIMPKCSYQENVSELKQYISRKLPSYMHPDFYQYLDEFPYTENNKIDKKQLLTIHKESKNRSSTERCKPETPTEKSIAKIWKSLLSVTEINVNDSFFDLGGHSLLVISLLGQIFSIYNTRISPNVFVENCTVRSLAKHIDENSKLC